ncbi:MAG: D-alanyl-D-alanine dipeptidase [Candidatus Omnitrophica bacterium]|nr:D-alanyl-D-alanine dipeptidase [Candidatus Omnitrophota bacterium]
MKNVKKGVLPGLLYKGRGATLFFAFFIFNFSLLFASESALVDIQTVNPRIRLEIRYATADNFMKEPLYPKSRCLLRPEVAARLSRVQDNLEKRGLGLKIFDGYRPLSVQKKMWARFPVEGYIANPAKGSNHNRGAAVDLTLVDADGRELSMPTPYDEFSERAHRSYAGGTEEERRNRQILQEAMETEGFTGLSTEWWHFDDKAAKAYPVLDLPL